MDLRTQPLSPTSQGNESQKTRVVFKIPLHRAEGLQGGWDKKINGLAISKSVKQLNKYKTYFLM